MYKSAHQVINIHKNMVSFINIQINKILCQYMKLKQFIHTSLYLLQTDSHNVQYIFVLYIYNLEADMNIQYTTVYQYSCMN